MHNLVSKIGVLRCCIQPAYQVSMPVYMSQAAYHCPAFASVSHLPSVHQVTHHLFALAGRLQLKPTP